MTHDGRPLAVLGAGTMGHGIAHAALTAGYHTRLYDVTEAPLQKAVGVIRSIFARSVELGKDTADNAELLLGFLSTTTSVAEAVRGAGVVIEAAPEKMDLKLALLAEVQSHAPVDAVIASNTSALSISEMAAVLDRPGRMGGMHFFNPVQKMKLVEVVRALETSDDTVRAMLAVATAMGKQTVLVKESPGFITSRINAMIGNEAFYMLQEGVASARDIDTALKLGLNHPMGPFELVDLVGLDTRLSILQHLHRTLGEKFRPCALLEAHVAAGRLGRKVGRGVFDY
jgi:3-hydroxybutyryl-CoA dehydrogenase